MPEAVFYDKRNTAVKIFLKNFFLGKYRLYKRSQIVYVFQTIRLDANALSISNYFNAKAERERRADNDDESEKHSST